MEKSGKKVSRSRNQKPLKNIVNFPQTSQADSSKPLPQRKEAQPPVRPKDMAIPKPSDGLTASKKKLMRFLGNHKIGKRAFEMSAKIDPILNRTIGGRLRAIETLKFSKDPAAIRLLEFCEKLDWNTRQELPIEAFCIAAGVDPTQILGAIILAARDVSRAESALITMREHPDVVEATAVFAKNGPDNAKDREMFHKAAGWLPTPKGSNINVNVFDPKKDVEGSEDDEGPDIDGVFGTDVMEIENWGNDRQKLLANGKKE